MNKETIYDMIVVGGGPAGLTAAIYAARARFLTLVLEEDDTGGQISITTEVVNYPGIKKISGSQLTDNMREQALAFGARFQKEKVIAIDFSGEIKKIKTEEAEYKTFGVILAVGARPRTLGFPGEKEFMGRGIAYCATCDGEFFKGKQVFVVGAGFAAAEEAVFLTRYAKQVTIIAREPEFTCAKGVAEAALGHEKIEVKFHTEVVRVEGDNMLRRAVFINNQTKEQWEYEAQEGDTFGMFIFVGYAPATDILKEEVELDRGYIVTDQNKKTNIDGVYAAGDVTIKNLRQVVTAVSDGAIAATSLEEYVEKLHKKYNITRMEEDFKQEVEENSSIHIETDEQKQESAFITSEIKEQLKPILEKLNHTVSIIGIWSEEEKNGDQAQTIKEMELFLNECKQLHENIKVSIEMVEKTQWSEYIEFTPTILLAGEQGYSGIQYHGIPSGHEFNSFITAIYHIAGPGKELEKTVLEKIQKIKNPVKLKILVSLSCTKCPEVVMGSQKIALKNKNVDAQMIDIAKFPEWQRKYDVMSVPCLVINEKEVVFGKKTIEELTDIILAL